MGRMNVEYYLPVISKKLPMNLLSVFVVTGTENIEVIASTSEITATALFRECTFSMLRMTIALIPYN